MANESGSHVHEETKSWLMRLSAPWKLMLAALAMAMIGAVLLLVDDYSPNSTGTLPGAMAKAQHDVEAIVPSIQTDAEDYLTGQLVKSYSASVKFEKEPSRIFVSATATNQVPHQLMVLQGWTPEQQAGLSDDQREHLKANLRGKLQSIAARTNLRLIEQDEGFEIRGNGLIAPRSGLIFAGLILSLGAIWWRFQSPLGATSDDRMKPACLIALAGAVALLGWIGLEGWDSMRIFFGVTTVVAVVTALIVLMPLQGRKIAISLLVLAHFGGILTAVSAVPARDQTPWLPTWVWARVYRPYLSFAYMNNAYHFYSPEPGPPTSVWFLLEYEKEQKIRREWLQVTTLDQCATRLEYQRLFALTESVNRRLEPGAGRLHVHWQRRVLIDKYNNLRQADPNQPGKAGGPNTDERPLRIPLYTQVGLSNQYHKPNEQAKAYLKSYVRHVAKKHRHLTTDPGFMIHRIKAYKLIHNMLQPSKLRNNADPQHPTTYEVYFLGEFLPNGELKYPRLLDANGRLTEERDQVTIKIKGSDFHVFAHDLYLYWRLPVYAELVKPDPEKFNSEDPRDYYLYDYFSIHAGKTPPGHWGEIVRAHQPVPRKKMEQQWQLFLQSAELGE